MDKASDMQLPDPLEAMTEHNKLTYSTQTRSLIADYAGVLRKRLEPDFGVLQMENYQLPPETTFENVVQHYENIFANTDGWETLDDSRLNWSGLSNAAGWLRDEKIFVVFTAFPSKDTDMVPVQTLSNL